MIALPPKLFIGTSGWHYDDWKGTFYPSKLPAKQFLSYYAERFKTVEVNNTFYHLPLITTAQTWYTAVPPDFAFVVKASRFMTHLKRLHDCREPLKLFLEWAAHLKEKLHRILFQLPPHWTVDPERLQRFFKMLPDSYRYVFEFRDPSWYTPAIYELLEARHIALCVYDREGKSSPTVLTSDTAYLRFHGPQPRYHGSYTSAALKKWAGTIRTWMHQKKTVYIYFNNDYEGNALRNAEELAEML